VKSNEITVQNLVIISVKMKSIHPV